MNSAVILVLLVGAAVCQQEWVKEYTAFDGQDIPDDMAGWNIQNSFQGNKVSKCGKVSLVGGYNAFGRRAVASKNLRVPPHYKLRLQVELWKIDSWDNEKMQIYVDGFLWEAQWHYSQGDNLCGAGNDWKEKKYDIDIEVPHNSPNVNIIMTSTLDQDANDESWGFRDVRLFYLACPAKCGICNNANEDQCFMWDQVFMSWAKEQVSIEGWQLEGGKPESNECAGVNIFGGQGHIGKGSVLSKEFQNLPPHYALLVKFQFWKIDSWDNEQFRVHVDNQLAFHQNFQWNEGVQLCGKDTGGNQGNNWAEKVVNVEFQHAHSTNGARIQMTSTLNEDFDNESWGIRDFFLFVGECHQHCESCTGPAKSDCTACGRDFTLDNGVCKEGGNWYILDQDFFQEADFGLLKGWTLHNVEHADQSPFTSCGSTKLVGGFERFGNNAAATRQLVLPPHNKLRIKVQLWKIDSWDDEEIYMKLDGEKIFSKKLGFNDPGQAQICGQSHNNWNERVINVDEIVLHSGDKAVLTISSTLNQGAADESWGFREFMLMYEPDESCVTFFSECGYKGKSFDICRNTPALSKSSINMPIKSIKIPDGVAVQGYKQENYEGQSLVYKTSQECIKEFEFSLLQTSHQTQWRKYYDLELQGQNLRTRRID